MKKTIFLTGAAGFIGSYAAERLIMRGDTVIGFDNFNDYYSPKLKRDRSDKLKKSGMEIIEGDLCDSILLQKTFQEHSFTHVLHLAAQAGVRYSLENPNAYISSNIQGFVNLLEVCKQKPSMPFIYASSSSVYGANEKTPFAVEDAVDRPVNLYGATKKANEAIAYAYHHLYAIPMTGLRFFTVYGPWGRPDMAYFSFTKDVFEGNPIRVFNHGKMKRDFTYIDDIVSGTLAALDLGAPWELFNLGNNQPEELCRFISLIENALGKKAILRYEPMQKGDMLETFADIDHSYQRLGFKPTTPLDKGIPKFVEWYLSYRKL